MNKALIDKIERHGYPFRVGDKDFFSRRPFQVDDTKLYIRCRNCDEHRLEIVDVDEWPEDATIEELLDSVRRQVKCLTGWRLVGFLNDITLDQYICSECDEKVDTQHLSKFDCGITNCLIMVRPDQVGPMFNVENNQIRCCLARYAIVPIEDYEKYKAAYDRQVEREKAEATDHFLTPPVSLR